nr:hypothetical protein [Tanacetum cinerariifolium]
AKDVVIATIVREKRSYVEAFIPEDKSIAPKDKAVVVKAEADACCTVKHIVVKRVNAHVRERAAAEV